MQRAFLLGVHRAYRSFRLHLFEGEYRQSGLKVLLRAPQHARARRPSGPRSIFSTWAILLLGMLASVSISCADSSQPSMIDLQAIEAARLPYRLVAEPASIDPNRRVVWRDINNDGVSERIILTQDPDRTLGVKVYGQGQNVWQQYNVPGGRLPLYRVRPFLFANLDNDPREEFIFSYIIGDTTYLEVVDDDFETQLSRFPVAVAPPGFGSTGKREHATVAKPEVLYDVDRNGSLDVVCSFAVGFAPTPRGVYAFDLQSGRLVQSYRMPQNPDALYFFGYGSLWFEDLNADGLPELVPAYIYAVDNGIEVGELNDSHSYLYVLNAQLQPLYVEKYGDEFSRLVSIPLNTPEGRHLLTVFTSYSMKKFQRPKLRLYNLKTFRVERSYESIAVPLAMPGHYGVVVADLDNDGQPNIMVATKQGKVYVFDWTLRVLMTQQFSDVVTPATAVDLNEDGSLEVLCETDSGLVVLGYRDGRLDVLALSPEVRWLRDVVRLSRGATPRLVVVGSDERAYFLTYQLNWISRTIPLVRLFSAVAFVALLIFAARRSYDLKRERHKRTTLTEFAAAGIVLINEKGVIEECNGRASHLLGVEVQKLTHRPLTDLLQLDDLPNRAFFERLLSINKNRLETKESHELTSAEGARRISLVAKPILSADGRFRGSVVTLWDDTAALESERTLTWAAMAQRMAHELKSPLSTIALTVQRLQMQYRKDQVENQERYDAYVHSVLDETRRFQQVAKGFMQFVNLEKPSPEPVDLTEFFDDFRRDIKDRLPSEIRFSIELEEELPPIRADRGLFKAALQNLVENAADAMKREGLLRIRAEKAQHLQPAKGGNGVEHLVCIEIADTGAGIPAEKQSEVFKPYFSTKSHGTGLGLVITKKIVEDHGGEIFLSSREGHGTTVYVYWPVA